MITCILQGGLGNQMFQVAATVAAARKHNQDYVFSSLNHHLPLQGRKIENYKNNILSKVNIVDDQIKDIFSFIHYKERSFSYNEIKLNPGNDYILTGYFQSEKYFKHIEKEIKQLFSVPPSTEEKLLIKYNLEPGKVYVSMHIRRGDYLRFPDVHPACTEKYYREAIKTIDKHEKIDKILVFSDDILWCKDVFEDNNKFIFVEEDSDYLELYLMSMCKHNILANSTFSWWAGWLNNDINKIITVPSKWFGSAGPQDTQDLIPKEWVLI